MRRTSEVGRVGEMYGTWGRRGRVELKLEQVLIRAMHTLRDGNDLRYVGSVGHTNLSLFVSVSSHSQGRLSYGLSQQCNAMVAVFLSSPLKYANMYFACCACWTRPVPSLD